MKDYNRKDLVSLCQLLHKKNEIQNRRHYARKRALRIQSAMSFTRLKNRKKSLVNYVVRLEERQKVSPNLNFSENIVRAKQDVERCYVPNESLSSKRMLSMSQRDLKIEWYKAHIADNKAKLDIAIFTRKYGRKIRAILKRNGWVAEMDNTNGRFVGVRKKGNWERNVVGNAYRHEVMEHQILVTGRDQIAKIAIDESIDEVLFG